MLRSIAVILITLTGICLSFKDAFWGLLLYTWYSFFSPLELTYGMLADSRLSLIVAISMIFTAVLQSKPLMRLSPISFLVLAFAAVAFAGLAVRGTYNLTDIVRETSVLNTLCFVAIFSPALIDSINKLKLYVLTIALSVGLLAAYYGIFGLLAGSTFIAGAGRIGDNNNYALLLVSVLPLLPVYIKHAPSFLLRWGLVGVLFGVLLAIVLTYSRGGFLALALGFVLWLIFVRKRLLLPLFLVLASLYWVLLSAGLIRDFSQYSFDSDFRGNSVVRDTLDNYLARINTVFEGAEETDSGRSRLHFWRVAMLMAADRPLVGVGLKRFPLDYERYDFSASEFGGERAVHSTPFLILAELGYLGFFIFMMILAFCIRSLWRARGLQGNLFTDAEKVFLKDLSTAVLISFFTFFVAGAFVVGLYLESLWALISVSITVEYLLKQRAKLTAEPIKILQGEA